VSTWCVGQQVGCGGRVRRGGVKEAAACLWSWETHLERDLGGRDLGTGVERGDVDHGDLEGEDVLGERGERGMSATRTSRPTPQAGQRRGSFPTRRR